jgi:transcriptional regulator with XRE-family HTH domain
MHHDTAEIAERLQAARNAKGLSQRELSDLAGVPQAQISRIESGTVDLRLSSLFALAHALDLELALVPRKAVPAVRALSRDTLGAGQRDVAAVRKEMQRIAEAFRDLQVTSPSLDGLQQLQKSFSDLQQFRASTLDTAALKKLRRKIEQISRPTQEMAALRESLKLMQTIRNMAAHDPPPANGDAPSRPAYSLDEEDDDV